MKKSKKELWGVPWNFFNIQKIIENMENSDAFLGILIFGVSGEGKSFFAAEIMLYKLIHNIDNNIYTIVEAASNTQDAVRVLNNLGVILNRIYPEIEKTWNTPKCLVQCVHTGNIDSMVNQVEQFKMKNKTVSNSDEIEEHQVERLWYLDDLGSTFSSAKHSIKTFFEDLCTWGRHNGIMAIFCSQKMELPKPLCAQVQLTCFVGELTSVIWETYKKRIGWHLSDDEKFAKWLTQRIGRKKSRNILIVDKTLNCVLFHKLSAAFLEEWEPLMKNKKKKIKKKIIISKQNQILANKKIN